MVELLVYSTQITPRVRYIFRLLLEDLMGMRFQLTCNEESFISYQGPKLNYSKQAFSDEVFIAARSLLFEKGLKEQDLELATWEQTRVFFLTYQPKSCVPFDLPAAAFYLVSRYEEYLPFIRDKFGRYEARQSLAFREGFLQKPVVDIWAFRLKDIILQRYPGLSHKPRKFHYIPTIDIDCAFNYIQKGFIRTVGGYFKSLSAGKFSEITERTKVLLGLKPDPFDTFDFQFELVNRYHLRPVYFILLAQYGVNDKNIPVSNISFQTLIRRLGDYAIVGIHPSYASNQDFAILKQEKENLEKVLHREITHSRQHFLKLHLPQTYRNLISLGIQHDYTMGYADETGFRASISSDFNFFDLEEDTETQLRVHPFAIMEGTLRDYKGITSVHAMNFIKPLVDEVKAVNGTFISLWHNDSLSETGRWVGWSNVYIQMLDYIHGEKS